MVAYSFWRKLNSEPACVAEPTKMYSSSRRKSRWSFADENTYTLQTKILILDDDKRILEILAFAVGREGYQIIKASNGPVGIQAAKERLPDLIILDSSSNDDSATDIVEVCACLRTEGVTASILVLIKAEEEEQALRSAGAEDFIIKPFAMRDLLKRVRANTWHITADQLDNTESKERLVFDRIIIDLAQIIALKDNVPLDLTQLEFDLLAFLARHPGKVFSRHELLLHVWGYASYVGDIRAVDVSIRRLREKIEDDPASPAVIITRRGRGYLFAL